jgi:ADP-heptose:LPS heptosyltransferase
MSEEKTRPAGAHINDFSHRTTLPELIWVLRQARWVISVDSGPMHIAAGVNDRTLGIHTWSDPRKVGPYNPRAWVWKAGRIAHRTDFTPAESTQERSVAVQAAEQIAAFVIQQIRYCGSPQIS